MLLAKRTAIQLFLSFRFVSFLLVRLLFVQHHFYSLAPYYWPDPSVPSGLPYLLRDGALNPEVRLISDQKEFSQMAAEVYQLALGYWLLEDERYALRAANLLEAWYVAPSTRMYPSLEHAQIRLGHDRDFGQPSGIIELAKQALIVDALAMLNVSTTFQRSPQLRADIRSWFVTYLGWMRNSSFGIIEHQATNNHRSYFNLQASAIAAYVKDWSAVVRYLQDTVSTLIPTQISSDGSQPLELRRTNSWHYSVFNLEALCRLASISQHLTTTQSVNPTRYGPLPDIFAYNADPAPSTSRSIFGAIAALMPYVPAATSSGGVWNQTHLQTFPFVASELAPSLRLFLDVWNQPAYNPPDWAAGVSVADWRASSDLLQPLQATQIAWAINGPDARVFDSQLVQPAKYHSFALLISAFKEYFPFFLPIGVVGVYRWSSFLVRAVAGLYFLLRNRWPSRRSACCCISRCCTNSGISARFDPRRDATIVVPTIDYGSELKDGLRSWLANSPAEIIFVTSDEVRPLLQTLVEQVQEEFIKDGCCTGGGVADTHRRAELASSQQASSDGGRPLCRPLAAGGLL